MCDHRITRWVERVPFPEDPEFTVREQEVEHTVIDLDTHRYKCTQCGEVMYYSERAKIAYTGKGYD